MEKEIRVLVIDDDEEDFMITKNLFKDIPNRKYKIDWVSSYQAGIDAIKKTMHDIYLVDYRLGMDEENGLNVIREGIGSGCKAPLIILTGQRSQEIDEEAMKSGAHDFLVKGQVTARELESSIRYSINHAKNIHEIKNLNSELERRVADRTVVLQQALEELEKSKAETELALRKEKELNELKSRFVTMASHEFRTPLSTILSSINLIRKYEKDDQLEKRLKHVERIKISVSNLTEILEDFLSLGKLEEGAVSAQLISFDMNLFCNETILEMQALAKKGQIIRYEYSGVSDSVILDPKIIKNIIINLLSNAVKFSDEGKEIFLSVKNTGNIIEISVKDQGIGIPDFDQKHMFERFFRATNAINIQGTGLGLNIVSKYVEMLKGDFSFVSKLGEGTTFTVKFPLVL